MSRVPGLVGEHQADDHGCRTCRAEAGTPHRLGCSADLEQIGFEGEVEAAPAIPIDSGELEEKVRQIVGLEVKGGAFCVYSDGDEHPVDMDEAAVHALAWLWSTTEDLEAGGHQTVEVPGITLHRLRRAVLCYSDEVQELARRVRAATGWNDPDCICEPDEWARTEEHGLVPVYEDDCPAHDDEVRRTIRNACDVNRGEEGRALERLLDYYDGMAAWINHHFGNVVDDVVEDVTWTPDAEGDDGA